MHKFMLCWIILLSLFLLACQPAGPDNSNPTNSTEPTQPTFTTPPTEPTLDATQPPAPCAHSYEMTVIEPGQYEDGARVYTCTHCGHSYDKVLYATGSQGLEMHQLGNGTYAVSSIGSCTDTDVVIPAYYEGHLVTQIMGFGGNDTITSIRIPATVTAIDSGVFRQCSNLKTIYFPESVRRIGQRVFTGCNSLETVYYGTDFDFVNQYRESPLAIDSIKKVIFGGTSVHSYICAGTTNLEEVVMEDGVTSIYSYAFSGCAKLQRVYIPASVTSIFGAAFSGCDGLQEIHFSGTVAQWDAIAKTEMNKISSNCKVICADGQGVLQDHSPATCQHDYQDLVSHEAGCETYGFFTPTCALCGATTVQMSIEPLGHDWVNGTCSRCKQAEEGCRPLTAGQWQLAGTSADGRELGIITLQFTEDGSCAISVEFHLRSTWEEAQERVKLEGCSILEFEGDPYLMTGSYTYSNYYICSATGDQLRLELGTDTHGIQPDLGDRFLYLRRDGRQLVLDAHCEMFMDPTFTHILNTVGAFDCCHQYVGAVTQEATCQQEGVWELTCAVCGDLDIQQVQGKHRYESGACVHCGGAAPRRSLSEGTWVTERASGDGMGLSVLELKRVRNGQWGYDIPTWNYYGSDNDLGDFFATYAPFSMHRYAHEGIIYSTIFYNTSPFVANITEKGDTVTMEIGVYAGDGVDPPYHTYTTVVLQRISGNQYIVTQGDDWGGILLEGEILTCLD